VDFFTKSAARSLGGAGWLGCTPLIPAAAAAAAASSGVVVLTHPRKTEPSWASLKMSALVGVHSGPGVKGGCLAVRRAFPAAEGGKQEDSEQQEVSHV
jgi:hypothetical protein